MQANFQNLDFLYERSILTPKNREVDEINTSIIATCPGNSVTFLSADTVEATDDVNPNLYPIELLNSIAENGIPAHALILKIGVPVMILRNLDPGAGINTFPSLLI